MKNILALIFITISFFSYAQVDTTFIYNTNAPYGTLDIRISKSATRYYYLEENRTVSFRENASGAKTNTFLDMTSWDSSPYTEGNLREKNGASNSFIMNYRLLFPVEYQPDYTQGYPLIVMMHGAGERANCWDDDCYWADRSWKPSSNSPPAPTDSDLELLNNDHNMSHGGKPHLDARNRAGAKLPDDPSLNARAFPGFVLFGQNLNGWDTNSTQDMIRLIRLAVKKYNIDPNKIYIHGLSNGAIAVYNVLKRAPWLFAAALPMSAPTDAGITSSATLTPTIAHIPLWIFQGGQDTEPAPNRTEGYIRKFREAGADVRYSLYPNLGHGTWNAAYAEPEFFSWIRSKDKTQVHVFFNNPTICAGTGGGVKLGLAAGFLAYQWQKNGQNIAGATGPEYIATQPGVYRARFSRESTTPGSSEWEKWSQDVTITLNNPVKANIIPLTTTHLRGPDNAGPNTIRLKSASRNDLYFWYKNGVRINIPNNSADDTVSIYTITGTSTNNNGAYTLVTATGDGCPGTESDPVNLFFSNSAPLLPDGNIPGSFSLVSATGSTANFSWADRSSVETAYEIWRRAPGESFILAGRTPANATSFNDTGLVPSTTYDYKIRVVNNQGRSRYAPSDNIGTNLQVTTQGDNVPPTAPQNLKVVRNTTSSISLSWTASTDNNGTIKHYVVYYGSESKVTGSNDPFYTLTDLPINQSYPISVKAVDNADLFSPASNQVTGTTSVTGLWYGHSTGSWTDLDQINWTQPEYTGNVPNFTLEPRTQEEFFNFEFTGYLYINNGGTYYFYLNSNDGSRLYIDGNQVVDFNGIHGISGANEGYGVKSAAVSLNAGAHDIRVIFFESTGGQTLSVAYQGADSDNVKEYIPDEALTSGDPGSSGGSACAGTGTIIREVWTGITGKEISSIPVNSPPSSTSVLTIFEGPFRVDDNYGARIRGYICVPETGDYTFWIASDDRSELWLSTNDNPGSKVLIASVGGATSKRQWDKYASQQSLPIHLAAEQKYYIEALHKESVTYDHVAVGWQLPDGTLERPIPGNRLMPFESETFTTADFMAANSTATQADNLTASADGNTNMDIDIFPNPAQGGIPELTISTYGGVQEATEITIEIVRMTGEVVHSQKVFCEANCDAFPVNIDQALDPGVYLISVSNHGKRSSKRLMVK